MTRICRPLITGVPPWAAKFFLRRPVGLLIVLWLTAMAGPGCNLYYDVDETSLGDDAGYELDSCQPESKEELQNRCHEVNSECGSTAMTDRCGDKRDVDCGDCPDGYDCEDNQCHCVPEPRDQLCAQLGDDPCGVQQVEDHCGETLFVDCGSCADGQQCNADNQCLSCEVDCTDKCGLVPDGCGEFIDCSDEPEGVDCDASESCENHHCVAGDCEPISDCDTEVCGQIPDGCGDIVDCDFECEGDGETCLDNQCICIPESDSELCEDASPARQCGTYQTQDRCGNERWIDCGECEGDDICHDYQCIPPECVGRDLNTDFENCGSCGNRCEVDETCIDGACEALDCSQDQGDASASCDPIDSSGCDEDQHCSFQLGGQPPDMRLFLNCLSLENTDDVDVGQTCSSEERCKPELFCVDWRDNRPTSCAEICRRDGHEGCSGQEYCANPYAIDDDPQLEEMGFCTERCSPQDENACSSTQRCTADPVYPAGTCHPNFRCINNGGSSGKSEGDSCDRARLHEDGCPSGLNCAPVGSDDADICVRPCTEDEDCDGDSHCTNAPSPWQALRYCALD